MPLMPAPPRKTGSSRPLPVPNDYHSYAFKYLFDQYPDQIRSALIDTGLEFRRRNLRRRVRNARPKDHFESWDLLRPYLDDLEKEIESASKRHSRAYWFHLYRRLAPVLSEFHDGKVDPLTAILVRKIADQALVKYGSDKSGDLIPITHSNAEGLLGGYFAKSVIDVGGDLKSLFDRNYPRPCVAA